MTLSADIASALITWVTDTVPEIDTTHDYPEITDFGQFPDLALDFRQIRTMEGGAGRLTTAHARRKQFQAVFSILVAPRPYRESAQLLWSMADRLIAAQNEDRTLGFQQHGIAMDSTPLLVTLPGIISRQDGTEARELVAEATITVPA